MKDDFYAVIMAGGGGTRLWPVSTKAHPKQMLKLASGKTLFEISVDRIRNVFDFERIFVVTIADQIQALHDLVPDIPLNNFLVEPQPRGTASVVGLAAIHLNKLDSQATMAVLTADHIIKNIEVFKEVLLQGKLLAQDGLLVTLGIEPTYPATGYGYIEMGDHLSSINAYHVKQFVEKPDIETAKKYLDSRQYFWNSGMFIWQADIIFNEIQKQMPELADKLSQLVPFIGQSEYSQQLNEIWPTIQPQTIDYGIMEHARNVAVIPAREMGWSDIGSWDSLFDFFPIDEKGNLIHSNNYFINNVQNTLVYSDTKEKFIAVVGVDDLVIVESDKGILICKKGQSELVKEVVAAIKNQKSDKYL